MPSKPKQGDIEREVTLSRVLQSKTLSGSNSARQILKFIGEKSLAGCIDEIKEYTIATEALGRPQDFDPRADNIVRVQVQRLRKKLEDYYGNEGADDPLRIVIPLGRYHTEFHPVSYPSGSPPDHPASPTVPAKLSSANPFRHLLQLLPWAMAFALLALTFASRSRPSRSPEVGAPDPTSGTPLPDALSPLWKPFLSSSNPPLIVYSNAPFLISGAGDLYRLSLDSGKTAAPGTKVSSVAGLERPASLLPKGIGSLYFTDLMTGTGEVVAAARIAQLLTGLSRSFSIKRSGVASFEDLRNSNVIFLGANFEDSLLKDTPIECDLVFQQSDNDEFIWSKQIRDRHPGAGQPSVYGLLRDAKTRKLEGDIALISLLPGVLPDRYILVLGGLTTIGTQASAEFAISAKALQTVEQMRTATAAGARPGPYFQALLRVGVRDGVAVKTDCLLVRDVRP
jgi:hypothetical protein